jgi:HD-GYP domain-containing protein (c-di-GMP phosphodiesterase class II)
MLDKDATHLRAVLVQTLEAIARIVETHDPYTAGHQRRVAVLGREMARTMQLAPAMVEGVYLGGVIHDIGKLYLPADILNRPSKLNEVEFLLIKTHCAMGRDIISGIDFPWPLAAMVYQHHERLDGSGYPQKLRGDQILLQARILAIADVVDAMASRRPYREALGLDAALAEIDSGQGSRYDHQAVAACIHLFVHNNLRLEDLDAAT